MGGLVTVKNLSKTYVCNDNIISALEQINLEITDGEFVAIVGRSGSGKSTFMNILGGLDKQTSGEYSLNGKDLYNISENQISKIRNEQIGFIFQGFNLIPTLTAIENVELPLIYRKVKKTERLRLAKKALEQVGLENRIHHRPFQMSGGQQQRVAIARAICGDPSIILADEPTGNLDSASGSYIINILKKLNKNGKTIILITHDDKLASLAPRIITFRDGKLISDFIST